ncbi:hypothetical protein L226DRAFT_499814 [Lentinus tigrinus ALCF2SS1-7]|uniref:Arrestin-like N-terminal domain-containing protein n=1 Tax=Lentinus tigrinus ALCF2SS1-6 TaxID=1328759 RepID=A0A5C2SUD4_9APHY|nr:hypothetical protein L227DRAFT_538759 [Lentinus tigrinus ALCF2SS1-6]RPD81490.1 hypothetical protein L226DRAFT_499814 [Lentinus tigrinus ALCF2SS1-7]
MFSRLISSSSPPPFVLHIPPLVYVAGGTIGGEVEIDFRQLREQNIEEIQVRLRGRSETYIHRNNLKNTVHETIRLVHENQSLWHEGGAYPPAGSDTLRVPFSFKLPDALPPSFRYDILEESATIRYALTAVGVRKGLLNFNKKYYTPIAVLPRDDVGAKIREDAQREVRPWKKYEREERIRKGLWGDYAKVKVELSLPDIPVLPLFSAIPYTVYVETTTAPQTRAKAGESSKPIFPPVPASPHQIDFRLRRRLQVRADIHGNISTADIATFLGGKEKERDKAFIESHVPEKEWVPFGRLADGKVASKTPEKASGSSGEKLGDAQGVWVQRASFQSTFTLSCPPTFGVQNIQCEYKLALRVPFPGIGNDIRLQIPVQVTSGIVTSAPRQISGQVETEASHEKTLDLPPAYWDANDNDWGDDKKQ